MTTIIVVVVVALVFFVAVCVVAFMIWKREAEMRTDSIRAIEENLERLTQEMSPEQERQSFAEREADVSYMDSLIAQSAADRSSGRRTRTRGQDPFEWVRENGEIVRSGSVTENERPFRIHPASISGEDGQEQPDRGEATEMSDPVVQETDNAETGDNGEEEITAAQTEDIAVSETADEQEPSDEHDESDERDMHDMHDDAAGDDDKDTLPEDPGEEVCRKKQALTEMQQMLKELKVPETGNLTEIQHDEEESCEISLDFTDEMDTDSEQEQMASRMGYDVGRSGRKYTAAELEKLIKE